MCITILGLQILKKHHRVPVFMLESAVYDDVVDSPVQADKAAPGSAPSSVGPTVRKSFPESWIWDHFDGFVFF